MTRTLGTRKNYSETCEKTQRNGGEGTGRNGKQRGWDWQLAGVNEVERKGNMLAGWALIRQMLGDEFRDENGRRMSGTSAIKNWMWIRIGQQLKFWVKQGTKTALTQEILKLAEPEMASATEILSQAGVQLQGEDEDLVDSDDDTEREEDELDYLKIWDTGQAGA